MIEERERKLWVKMEEKVDAAFDFPGTKVRSGAPLTESSKP
jgi:hypothetical protein